MEPNSDNNRSIIEGHAAVTRAGAIGWLALGLMVGAILIVVGILKLIF